jgi:hypothetical protein
MILKIWSGVGGCDVERLVYSTLGGLAQMIYVVCQSSLQQLRGLLTEGANASRSRVSAAGRVCTVCVYMTHGSQQG